MQIHLNEKGDEQFDKNWNTIIKTETRYNYFKRMWKYYFAYCEVGFRKCLINDYQILFKKRQ